MIKAVIFDYGGVVADGGGANNELPERLAGNLGVSLTEAVKLMGLVWRDYMIGRITENQLWQTIEKACGRPIPVESRNIWNVWRHMQPRPEIVRLIKELKQSGIIAGLLSNVIPNTAAEIKAHGGYDLFDWLVLSPDVGHAKPEGEIYRIAQQKLPQVQPCEILYIDDQEPCLEPARQLGWRTILATSAGQIVNDATALLTATENNSEAAD